MSSNKSEFYALRKKLIETRSLYVDPEFPPDIKSISPTGSISRDTNIRRIEWKRPINISRNPKFVSATATRSDLDQGSLGNCWFVAGASLLVNGPRQQFERVVPLDQGFDQDNYAGIFRFNFWKYGRWQEVIIDDYLPTDGHRLVFCSNWEEKDEFWGALLEKAYAKFYGSYVSLDGGKLADALVDMTGGMSETFPLTNRSDIPHNFYDLLWKSSQMNSLIGGSINLPEGASRPEVKRSNGLYMGHAYSITALSVVPWRGSSVKLLRVRNPWGRKEWNGPWSDTSSEIRNLPMEIKRKLNIVIEEDGEFWISLDDFIDNFDEVQLCHLQPDALAQELAADTNKKNWSVTLYHDAWIKGVTAGGCGNRPYEKLYWKNPQFQVHLKDIDSTDNREKCTMIVSLMEKENRNMNKYAIGFDVYEVRNSRRRPLDDEALPQSALIHKRGSGKYQFYREVTLRFEFPPGYYVIIPSTFHPHEEAEFMLRIYTEKEVESEVMDEDNGPSVPTPEPRDSMALLFAKHAGEDGKMDYKELRQFLIEATLKELKESISFNREACRSLVTMMDKNRSGFLSWEEARILLKEIKTVFKQFDANRSNTIDTLELGSLFNKLGNDRFPVSRMVLTSIVRRYGGRDRRLSLEDFIIVMCKLTVMYEIFKEQQMKTGGPEDVAQFTRNEFLQYTMFC
ncbi:calpain-B-like isoform X3 [Ruditapes philippinarum]|uniref:calpain-B-like isoform X3 n=1 Tax=Ruditapes philippinarum TaxID=129788 RepID=UPI00295C2373|nr:calpain-B-like isoform X3 [Ruditapes philippinarum]